MANVTLITSEGSGATGSVEGKLFIMIPFQDAGVAGDSYARVYGHNVSGTTEPYILPFDGVINLLPITWHTYYKEYYIQIWVNGVMREQLISTQKQDVLEFSVLVSEGDTVGIYNEEVDAINPLNNYHLGMGLTIGEL